MQIGFGKYKDHSIEWLVLKDPSYVKWILDKSDLSGAMLRVKSEIIKLIEIFNNKPIQKKCYGSNCNKTAQRCTVYMNNVSPYWWCEECDPYQAGAFGGKLQFIKNYEDALDHVKYYANGNKSTYKIIITELAQAKGLPKRVGEKQANDFF